MITQIRITGQIGGNFRLATYIGATADHVEQFFQDHILTFKTKKQARKALSIAFRNLKDLEPDLYREGGIKYFPGSRLYYDASSARII